MAQFLITTNSKVNSPPTMLGDKNIIILNRSTYTFTSLDFTDTTPPYTDPDGDDPLLLKIKSIPSGGILYLNGIACTLDQEITFVDIENGLFTYEAANTNTQYLANFDFDIADVGSGLFSNLSPSSLLGTIKFTVRDYVNLPPTTIGDNSITLDYNETRIFTSADFTTGTSPAYSDPEGDPAERLKITSLPLEGSLRFNNVPVSVNQIILFSDITLGKLTYIANGNQAGYTSSFNFQISDSGSKQFIS